MNMSLHKFDFPEITILGLDREQHFEKHGLTDKLWALRDHMTHSLSNDSVVLFLDGYDVLANGHIADLLERFDRMSEQPKVLFAAEKGCSGTKESMMRFENTCDAHNPHARVNTPTPWINTGLFIGHYIELKALLDLAWIEYAATETALPPNTRNPYYHGTDQLLIYHIYKTHRRTMKLLRVKLDFYSDIFKCMYQVPHENVADISFYQNRLAVKHSQHTFPVLIHFNGNHEKKLVPVFAEKMMISGCHSGEGYTISG
jgi:hypothetical protein